MQIQITHGIGNHITIDAFGCEKKALDNKELIERILLEIPPKIDMNRLTEPKVVYHEAKIKEERGITGFIIMAESHTSIHTYPEKRFFALDIFSVKEFDVDAIKDYLQQLFQPKEVKVNILRREYNDKFKRNQGH